jgi:hypothetical protein
MILQTLTTSFKLELLQGVHNFNTDIFRIALYSSTADLNAATTVYTPTGEVSGSGYTTGGPTIYQTTPASDGTTAYVNFANVSWYLVSFTAAGALIYNASRGNKSVAVLSFGGDKTPSGGVFTVQFPSNTSTTALIRIT